MSKTKTTTNSFINPIKLFKIMSKKLLSFLTLLTLFFGVGWAAEVTDVLTRSLIGITSTNYSSWTKKTSNSDAVYGGNSAGGNNSIQLRNGSNSGIYTSASGGRLKSISVTWNSNTASGRRLAIYGKHTAYTGPSQVYNTSLQGERLGYIYYGDTSYGTTTSLTVDGDYEYFAIQPVGGAMYLTDITIVWETGTTTKYSVTCNSSNNGSISVGTTTEYAAGSTVTVTATPVSGYKLSTVTVNPTESGITAPTATVTGNTATFLMPASDVIVTATFAEIPSVTYERVSSLSSTDVGKKFLLVYENTPAVNGVINTSGSNPYAESVTENITKNGTTLTVSNDDAKPLTLGGSDGGWTFDMGGGNYLAWTSGNSLKTVTTLSNSSKWTISFSNGKPTIKNLDTSDREIRYNASSPRFACYTSGQADVYLYREVEAASDKAYDVTVTQATGGTITASPEGEKVVNAGDKITVTATPNPGYELTGWTITGASESAPDANNQITATGNVTITATFALAKNEIAYTIAPANSGEVWLQNGATYDQSLGYSYSTMGTTVSIALAAYPGYDVNSLAITDATGATVPFTKYNSEWNNGKWVTYYTFVMPATAVNIAATFKSGDIYILGTANDNPWDGNKGVKMTYDAGTNTYSADVYFASETATGKGQFSFASNLSGTDGNWNNIGKRWGAQSQDYDLVTNADGGIWTENNSDPNRFTVPYGVYTITVNWGTGLVTATKKDITVTLDKAAGQLENGTTVNVVSNLTSLLQACKSGVSATLAYSTDGGNSYTDGSSFAVNSDLTAKGKATYGTIEAESEAYAYTVVTHYAVTATANPENGGTVSVSPASALAGETVTITASPKSGYQLESITVNGTALEAVDGVYSFTMPAQATEVVANFSKIQYSISKVENNCTINITNDLTTAGAGDVVTFTVTPKSNKYYVSTVTLTWDGGQTQTLTATDGTYSFNMQARNVTITATCIRESVGDGSFVLVTDASTLKAGDKVIITNSKTAGSALAMSTTQNNNNRGSASVTITNDIKITPGTDVQVLTLESVDITYNEETFAGWYLNAGNGYLYAASSSSNYLRTGALNANEVGDNAKANIEIEDAGNAFIQFYGNNTRDVIMNNGSIFSCYASNATGMSPVYLFKQSETGLHVEIDPEGGQVIGSQEVTIDANIEGAMVQYKIGENGEWSTPAEGPVTTTITGNVGDNVKVYAKATMDDEGETLEDEINVTFTFIAPTAPTITPASCAIASETQAVTITSNYANATIEYSTDGGTTWNVYINAFNVVVEGFGESATVQARVTYNGVTSEIASATYTRGVQPVVFSPANGEYYHNQTCQMFSTTKGARIYYTTDGSEPVMNQGTTQLYTGEIEMTAGNTYNFKAVAYIGTTPSEVTNANYTILTGDYPGSNNYLYSIAELNEHEVSTSNWTMVNPVQVIYMSTYQQNGTQPEFCLVRDNTGYGMIYFGKQNPYHNNFHIFQMGDWISGGYYGPITMATSSQDGQLDTHPELGDSNRGSIRIHNWSEDLYKGNSTVLPEYITIPEILASETPGSTDYWGHYVHLRKNTVELTSQDKDGKWSGNITDENGNHILYYDKFYLQYGGEFNNWTTDNNLFTGHPNRTFDIYGFVACHLLSETHYQIAPFAFAWIDKPVIDKETATYYEPQTVTISSPEDQNATIWYKTSEMDDYAVYTEPFTVNSTTTIEWYATKQSQYNDELESKKGTITMTFATINPPAIAPESQVKAVGSESVNSTITRDETDGLTATIWFTIDGSDPSDPSSERYVYNAENQAALLSDIRTTTTVRAIAEVDGIYSAEAEARTYTFVKSNGIVYDLVTSVSQLNENGVYVIVSQNHSEALSTTQNTTNRGAAGVLFVEETNKAKVYGNDDVAQFTLTVLTHDEDTSPERHFLMQTNNSSQNGYLYVGSESNNTLLTEANEDAMGNDVAVITIDADGRAHIHFNYAGGDNRYLQYWNRDRLFNTYKTEYADRAVYIYGVNATPLATIEKEGTALPTTNTAENQYTIADQLIAVHYKDAQNDAGEHYLWCKDQGNVSISKSEKNDGQIDYLKDVTKVQKGDWDQSNWVVLKFTNPTNVETISGAVGKYINPASITGHYTDGVNFTITLPDGADLVGKVGDKADFTPNVYCPVNFLDKNLNIGGGQGPVGAETGEHYFFMNPKIQEVATVTYAVWNGTCFVIPAKAGGNNQGDFDGAFSVAWTYNAYGDQKNNLQANTAYRFLAVLNTGDAKLNSYANTGAKAGENAAGTVIGKEVEPQAGKVVYALDLNGDTGSDNIITAIQDVVDGTGKAVAGVKYYNLAGIESDRPFEGVNIIVTTYTDGSRSSSKVLK